MQRSEPALPRVQAVQPGEEAGGGGQPAGHVLQWARVRPAVRPGGQHHVSDKDWQVSLYVIFVSSYVYVIYSK